MAYRCEALIDLYRHTKVRLVWTNFCGRTQTRTLRPTSRSMENICLNQSFSYSRSLHLCRSLWRQSLPWCKTLSLLNQPLGWY